MTTWGGEVEFGVNNNKVSRGFNAKLSWFWANRGAREEAINSTGEKVLSVLLVI